jgi:hypothetical protein
MWKKININITALRSGNEVFVIVYERYNIRDFDR